MASFTMLVTIEPAGQHNLRPFVVELDQLGFFLQMAPLHALKRLLLAAGLVHDTEPSPIYPKLQSHVFVSQLHEALSAQVESSRRQYVLHPHLARGRIDHEVLVAVGSVVLTSGVVAEAAEAGCATWLQRRATRARAAMRKLSDILD